MPSLIGKTKHLRIDPVPRPVAQAAPPVVPAPRRSGGFVQAFLGLFRGRR